ncbi:MAG TPA: lysine-2,3-aminomutase-like protein [Stellaceae bacterium]|nr:lysine-2,3-aminomutase-like protein [Stellaceae bacterium]
MIRNANQMVEAGLIPAERAAALAAVAARYAVSITPDIAALIDSGDAQDPIARQFVPDAQELLTAPDERGDPIGDHTHEPVKGIVHRYPDRVLLKPVHVCPVYCRFCFRREDVGPGGAALDAAELAAALDYIRSNSNIWEVILSGGDPLMLSARRLKAIMSALDSMPHVAVIRIHTRVPVAAPGKLTPALVKALRAEKAVYVVLHANHPRELTAAVKAAAGRLSRAGIPLLSQSVLLKGVNDDSATLEALFRALVAMRVKPYYLHHPDLAHGTAHLRLGLGAGQALMKTLRGRVSGLCQPSYVLDLPGGHGKVPVGPCYARPDEASETECWRIEDPNGATHDYPPKSDV